MPKLRGSLPSPKILVTLCGVASRGFGSMPTIRHIPGAFYFYSYSCPYSRREFPAFVDLARRYAAVGVSFLAFSLDDDAQVLDAYLGGADEDEVADAAEAFR